MKIITNADQSHDYKTLAELFVNLSEEDRKNILKNLKVSQASVDNIYKAEIFTSSSLLVKKNYNITLSAKVYKNFVQTDEVVKYLWKRDSGSLRADAAWNSKAINSKTLVLTESDFGSNFQNTDVIFKLICTLSDESEIEDSITFTKTETASRIQIDTNGYTFFDGNPSQLNLSVSTNNVTPAKYSWYVNQEYKSNLKTLTVYPSQVGENKAIPIKLEVEDNKGIIYTDTINIVSFKTPKDGEQGVPGEPGVDGTTTYTWIKYADDETGKNMSDSPFDNETAEPKEYIGMAYNKVVPDESTVPSDYTWSKYIGTDGIPGENGYIWIKYSRFSDGYNTNGNPEMFESPYAYINSVREDMVYMGIAYNKQDKTESNNPKDYKWAKIKGNDGHTGYTLDLSNDNVAIPALNDGSIPNSTVAYSLANTVVALYYGNDLVEDSSYYLETEATNVVYTQTNGNRNVQIESLTADVGQILFKAYTNSRVLVATGTFSIIKIKGLSSYEIVPSTNIFKVSSTKGQENVTPNFVEVNIKENNGNEIKNITDGTLKYRYIFDSSADLDEDGTTIEIGKSMPIQFSEAAPPRFIEFKYFRNTATKDGVLFDKERIAFVKDGISGTYEETRYAGTESYTVPALNNTVDEPEGWTLNPPVVSEIGVIYMTKATKDTETKTLLGNWSTPVRITGPAGPKGPTGTASNVQIVPKGLWKADVQYKATSSTLDAVYYGTSWYVAIQGSGPNKDGVIKIGTRPTDTSCWNESQENYDFIATGLFLAKTAYIDNLGVNNLTTSPAEKNADGTYASNPKRVVISGENNAMEFFTGEESFTKNTTKEIKATLKLDASSGYSYGENNDYDLESKASIIIQDPANGVVSSFSSDGIYAKNPNTSYISAASGFGAANSCIVGYLEHRSNSSGIYAKEYNSGVAGFSTTPYSQNKDEGKRFGGFFNTICTGSQYYTADVTESVSNNVIKVNPRNGLLFVRNANLDTVEIQLPNMATLKEGWNTGAVYSTKIIVTHIGTVTFTCSGSSNTIIVNDGNKNAKEYTNSFPTSTGRQSYTLYWDGIAWQLFGYE